MVVFGHGVCNREEVDFLFGQKLLYSVMVVVLGKKWFYSGKSGFIRAK